ncbi:NTP transferase domain-containing protein [Mycolicibacterium sp. 018/SC-01/001]|uniref:nucleotidyltransferase family protein n=1 Tax=Mycolicibacterium sp. 018/SC-01/001 TaxID=2592069 RepID=UPI0021040474|nr:nucleotidyltransferase family protein [Mycolicibacterium sp. 018/SC-01/001]
MKQFSDAGVVLAAGAGTRFGMPKVLADTGQWLASAVAALADGGCRDVAVVLGAAVDGVGIPAPARAVVAHDWADGLSASVRAGLLSLGDADRGRVDHAVFLPVDTPDVTAAVVRRVLTASRRTGLARAGYAGRPGHPVVIARKHWPALLDTLDGDEGAAPFLRSRDDVVTVDCSDLCSGVDIDRR